MQIVQVKCLKTFLHAPQFRQIYIHPQQRYLQRISRSQQEQARKGPFDSGKRESSQPEAIHDDRDKRNHRTVPEKLSGVPECC